MFYGLKKAVWRVSLMVWTESLTAIRETAIKLGADVLRLKHLQQLSSGRQKR